MRSPPNAAQNEPPRVPSAKPTARLGSSLVARLASSFFAEPVGERPLADPPQTDMLPDHDLATWIDRQTPVMVLFARQLVGGHAAAEDVVQEAFLRFWKHRAVAQDPLAYLYQTVRRTAFDYMRGERRRTIREQTVAGQQASGGPAAFCSPLEQAEQRQLVERGLERLPQAQREILVLRIWGELKFSQIAEATGLSVNTITSRYRYALENLRRAMNKESLL